MWKFTEVADWFESRRTASDAMMDKWVEDAHYGQAPMIVAASTKSLTSFGAGFVDILRLGDGVASGTLGGVGKDAMRFVAIFPVGKAAQMLKSARGVAAARLVADTGGPICFWIASAKALRQIGQKFEGRLLASVEDMVAALGMNMGSIGGINLSAGRAVLARLGAKLGQVRKVSTVTEVDRMVPFDGSVVMVCVHLMKDGKLISGHAIYAFRTAFGRVRYMDRTVGALRKTAYETLDQIAKVYRADYMRPVEALVINNMFVKTLAHDVHQLVMPVLGVVASDAKQK